MTQTTPSVTAFQYQAQTLDGQSITGTIDAAGPEQAQRLLAALRIRVLSVETAAPQTRPIAPKPLRAEDFVAFNQQLAHLTSAGMPIEHGLRLIAQDMHSRRLAQTVNLLAAEMERGTPLQQALEAQQNRFPPLYAKLIGAGVASGNLPGMLLNLGRHMELVQRLRAALWRAAAYPVMVLIGIVLVLLFVAHFIIPQFHDIFRDFGTKLPALTEFIMMLPNFVPWIILGFLAIVAVLIFAWLPLDRAGNEWLRFRLPLIGPILRYNLLARWCDAVALSIQSGLDLPRSIELANDAVGSSALRKDSEKLIAALQAGNPVDTVQHTRLLPATAVATMSLASQQSDLGGAMNTLSEMYQQQAQLRLALLPSVLTPILLIVMAAVIGVIVIAMFLPLIALIQNISSPMKNSAMPFIVEIVVWFVLANFIMVLAFSMGYIGIFFFFLMIPLIARAIKATEQRRGAAVIAYLEQAVRLNLPLPPMLKAAQCSERGRLATRLGRLANSLATGVNMASAVKFAVPELRGAPVAAIASAENLGRLPHTLQRLARHNNARNEIDETETAFIRVYPFMMVISLFFLVTLIMVFVIPKYETIFKDFGVRLPWVTQLMMDFARNFGDLLVFSITTALVIWAIIWAWRIIHPRTARLIVTGFTDRLLWYLPIAHGYARDRGLAEAFDLIADALHAGQPIDHAADEAANLHVNRVLQIRLGYFATWLGSGAALHTAARQSQLPPLVVEMLAPAHGGEQVAEVFDFLARYYESRFSRTRLLLRGAAVPLMVLFFAFFVVWVALGMLMPMTDLINAIATPVMQWRI